MDPFKKLILDIVSTIDSFMVIDPTIDMDVATQKVNSLRAHINYIDSRIEEDGNNLHEIINNIILFIEKYKSVINKEEQLSVKELQGFLISLINEINALREIDSGVCDLFLNYLLLSYLRKYKIKQYRIFSILGIIEVNESNQLGKLNWGILSEALSENTFLKVANHFGWSTYIGGANLLNEINKLFNNINISSYLTHRILDQFDEIIISTIPGYENFCNDYLNTENDSINNTALRIPNLRIPIISWVDDILQNCEIGLSISSISFPGKTCAILIEPYGDINFSNSISFDKGYYFNNNTNINANSNICLLICPNKIFFFNNRCIQPSFNPSISMRFGRLQNEEEKALIKLPMIESQFTTYELGFKFLLNNNNLDFTCFFGTKDLTVLFQLEESDSFIKNIIGDSKTEVCIPIELQISTKNGLLVNGSFGFNFNFNSNIVFGPVTLQDISLKFNPKSSGIDSNCTLNIATKLGPLSLQIREIGVKAFFQWNGLNGEPPFDLDLGFKSPTGVGLSISSSAITGAGNLDFDQTNQRYSGGLGLQFGEIGLSAFGLIVTKPDEYSLLISICATFNPAIQLGYGFTLNGVGGLIAANRSIDVEKLRGGIKNHTLDGILFPDPNALVDVIGKMEAVFPVKDGQYVVGPMVKIGWGANLLTADIGVFIEFPDPVRILLLGQVKAALPKPDKPIVVINLDVIGVVDFAAAELTFQASLYDSKLLTFEICGDSAMLIGWGANPRFALAIGGFHPRFTPPSPASVFAGMKRMSINIGNAGAVQISCGGYMAITSNTLQFGAKAELFIDADSITVEGYIGFDALFIFSPFAFEVEIYAGVHLKWHGHSLFGLDLHFWLSGPNPWHARGTASIDLWLFSVDVGFDETWGDATPSTIAPVNPWNGEGMLKSALENPDNWGTQLPPRRSMVEILRERKPVPPPDNGVQPPPEPVILHPFGTMEIRQRVCPLGKEIQKIANAPVKEYNQFDLVDFKINGDSVVETIEIKNEQEDVIGQQIKSEYLVEEHFAPGQYLELTHDEKFTQPSFDKWTAGVKSSPEMQVHLYGNTELATLQYESAIYSESEGTSDYKAHPVVWANVEHLHFAQVARRELHRIDPMHRNSPEVQAKFVGGTKLSKRPIAAVREEQYCLQKMGDTTDPSKGSFYQMEQLKKERQLQDQLENKLAAKYFIIPEYQAS